MNECTPAQRAVLDDLLPRCGFAPGGTAAVCGVSGGADSLALLVLATAARLDVTAVHVDHGLRAGSTEEANLVASVATRFGAAFRAERIDIAPGSDLEARARSARRGVLGAGALTGHTADDQAETVLINLMRGAGVDGLAAMVPSPSKPLLGLRRADTEALCIAFDLTPFNDPSNADPRFVRNRVRHELLPLVADISERDPVPLLVRTADRARAAAGTIDELASTIDPTNCQQLRSIKREIAAAALRSWLRDHAGHPPSFAELERVFDVVGLRSTATELSGGRRVRRSGGVLEILGPAPPFDG